MKCAEMFSGFNSHGIRAAKLEDFLPYFGDKYCISCIRCVTRARPKRLEFPCFLLMVLRGTAAKTTAAFTNVTAHADSSLQCTEYRVAFTSPHVRSFRV